MTMQEIWQIKETLSNKFWGKSAEEINVMVKPNVDEIKRKIDEFRKKTKIRNALNKV